MHIVMVTVFGTDPHRIDGGVAGVSKYLADELVKREDIRLTVLVPKGADGETACEQWENFTVYRLAKKGPWRFLPGTFYDVFAGRRQVRSFLKFLSPDLVHFQGCAFLAANCRQPNILTIHGIVERDALWDTRRGFLRFPKWLLLKLTETWARRRVPNIILISEYVREFLSARNKNLKTWLIENPIADSFFEVDRCFEAGRIFCCSSIIARKNIIGMIKAFSEISKRFEHARLRIGGTPDADYLDRCQQLIRESGLGEKVRFLGNLSVRQVQKELSLANCLVIPSFQETAPLAIEEAMAAGVPVVGARLCGIPYMIEEGKTGYLIDPYEPSDIAEAVCRILGDDDLAASMSHRAREIARKRFKASAVCEWTVKAYNEVL